MILFIFIKFIQAQVKSIWFISFDEPQQILPPFFASGLSHFLSRSRRSSKLQDHGDHEFQDPSTNHQTRIKSYEAKPSAL